MSVRPIIRLNGWINSRGHECEYDPALAVPVQVEWSPGQWIVHDVVNFRCPVCERLTTVDEIREGVATISRINGDSRYGYEAAHRKCWEVEDLREQVRYLKDRLTDYERR